MSHAEYATKPLPVLTRLAVLLRHIPAVKFVLAKFGKLLRSHDASAEPVVTDKLLPANAPGDTNDAINDIVIPLTEPPDESEGDELAHRRSPEASSEPVIEDTLPTPAPGIANDIVAIDDLAAPVAEPPEQAERDGPANRGSHDASPEPVIEDTLPIPAPNIANDIVAIDDLAAPVAELPEQSERDEPAHRGSHDASPEAVIEDTLPTPAPSIANDIAAIDDLAAPVAELPEQSERDEPAHRGSHDASPEPVIEDTLAIPAPSIASDVVALDAVATPVAKPPEQSEREKLVRRRWTETGIRMWNPNVHGAGHAALKIQGRVELLPPKAGETLPRYDTLEFKLVEGLIVCEGYMVDPPERPVNRRFVEAASRHP